MFRSRNSINRHLSLGLMSGNLGYNFHQPRYNRIFHRTESTQLFSSHMLWDLTQTFYRDCSFDCGINPTAGSGIVCEATPFQSDMGASSVWYLFLESRMTKMVSVGSFPQLLST